MEPEPDEVGGAEGGLQAGQTTPHETEAMAHVASAHRRLHGGAGRTRVAAPFLEASRRIRSILFSATTERAEAASW